MTDGKFFVFRFGNIKVTEREFVLVKDGETVPVEPKAFRVLLFLLRNAGRLVTKDEILKAVWNDCSVSDNSLTRSIATLRRLLGDDTHEPRYIATVPTVGYRFLCHVDASEETLGTPVSAELVQSVTGIGNEEVGYRFMSTVEVAEGASGIVAAAPEPADGGEAGFATVSRWTRTHVTAGLAMLAVAVGLGLGVWWYQRKSAVPTQLVERQLTSNSTEDRVFSQSISPDGKYVAYSDESGLHLRVIATSEDHDLALPSQLNRLGIWWFPDGNALLVNNLELTVDGYDGTIWKVPVLGGSPTKLREHALSPAVSPVGSQIAFVYKDHEIWLMDAQGDNARMLFNEKEDILDSPQWSPDGRYLAYFRSHADETQGSIEVRRLDAGPAFVIVSGPKLGPPNALCWINDWRLVYSLSTRDGDFTEANLWATGIDPTTGRPIGNATQLTHWSGHTPVRVNASLDGKAISLTKVNWQDDVYVGELSNHGRTLEKPQRFTFDDRDDSPTAWMPDSRNLLFQSTRNGAWNTYRQDLNQQKAERILGTPETEALGATLTPDGAWILYLSSPKQKPETPPGDYRLMRVPVSGGSPELVQEGIPNQGGLALFDCPRRAATSCILGEHKDKELVFYALDPLKGKGKELARTEIRARHMYGWAVSPGGSEVAVVSSLGPFVRTIELGTGVKHDVPVPGNWTLQSVAWSPDGKAFFVTIWTPKAFLLSRVELSGQIQVLKTGGQSQSMNGIVPSPDGRYLAFGAQTWDSNVWLLEGF